MLSLEGKLVPLRGDFALCAGNGDVGGNGRGGQREEGVGKGSLLCGAAGVFFFLLYLHRIYFLHVGETENTKIHPFKTGFRCGLKLI